MTVVIYGSRQSLYQRRHKSYYDYNEKLLKRTGLYIHTACFPALTSDSRLALEHHAPIHWCHMNWQHALCQVMCWQCGALCTVAVSCNSGMHPKDSVSGWGIFWAMLAASLCALYWSRRPSTLCCQRLRLKVEECAVSALQLWWRTLFFISAIVTWTGA